MIKSIYAVRDLKAGYGAPFLFPNDEVAKREFLAIAKNEASSIHQNPEDYELWKLGTYNEDNGEFFNDRTMVCNCRFSEQKEA